MALRWYCLSIAGLGRGSQCLSGNWTHPHVRTLWPVTGAVSRAIRVNLQNQRGGSPTAGEPYHLADNKHLGKMKKPSLRVMAQSYIMYSDHELPVLKCWAQLSFRFEEWGYLPVEEHEAQAKQFPRAEQTRVFRMFCGSAPCSPGLYLDPCICFQIWTSSL